MVMVKVETYMGNRSLNHLMFCYYDLTMAALYIDEITFRKGIVMDLPSGQYLKILIDLYQTSR